MVVECKRLSNFVPLREHDCNSNVVETYRFHEKLQSTLALMKKLHKELYELTNEMQSLLFLRDNNDEMSLLG